MRSYQRLFSKTGKRNFWKTGNIRYCLVVITYQRTTNRKNLRLKSINLQVYLIRLSEIFVFDFCRLSYSSFIYLQFNSFLSFIKVLMDRISFVFREKKSIVDDLTACDLSAPRAHSKKGLARYFFTSSCAFLNPVFCVSCASRQKLTS